jgi:hypothetical protein
MSTANVDKIKIIFKALQDYYKLPSDKALADFLGVDYRTLSAWKSRGRIAKIDAFIDKCSGINIHWLKTGQGEMFNGDTVPLFPPGTPTHEELLKYFENKELARKLNIKLIKLEKIDPSLLKEVDDFLNYKLHQKGVLPDEELEWQELARHLKNGTSGQ